MTNMHELDMHRLHCTTFSRVRIDLFALTLWIELLIIIFEFALKPLLELIVDEARATFRSFDVIRKVRQNDMSANLWV